MAHQAEEIKVTFAYILKCLSLYPLQMRSITIGNGIRYRPAYNTRHTYATVCLMNGLNPVYVASQLGHSW